MLSGTEIVQGSIEDAMTYGSYGSRKSVLVGIGEGVNKIVVIV